MTRIRAAAARLGIFVFGLWAAYDALHVTSMGRLNVPAGENAGLAGALSRLAASLGRTGLADMLSRLGTGDVALALALLLGICFFGELCFQGAGRAKARRYVLKYLTPGLVLLAFVWVIFRLNNTSLFAWNNYLKGNAPSGGMSLRCGPPWRCLRKPWAGRQSTR